MSNYPQFQIKSAIASKGDYTIPPLTPTEAGTGRLSQEDGWGHENAIPIEQGGIPPHKNDFNGILFLLSQFTLWYQQGGIMNYSALLNYEVGNEVLQNGTKYRCVKVNGPASTVVAPGSNRTYWKNIDVTVPAGAIMPFHNVKMGGKDNRNPIFWGTTQPDTGWVICDGGSDGKGGVTPNLVDKFVKGSTVENAGKTGGSATLDIPNIAVSGVIGGTALTVEQLPAHTHSGSTSTTGAHTHTKGSMNITGKAGCDDKAGALAEGCFSRQTQGQIDTSSSGKDGGPWSYFQFNANSSWTGETSSNGSHSHTFTLNSVGGGQTHTHTLTANSSISDIDNEPPFYTEAYFMKLPE